MATVNSKVFVSSFNNLSNSINNVLGVGSEQTGYGQSVSTPVSLTSGQKITSAHWAAVKVDLLKIAGHQGLTEDVSWTSGNLTSIPVLPSISTGTKITASDITKLENAILVLSDTSNLYKLAAGQYSDERLIFLSESTRTTTWNRTIRHFFTINFSSANNARHFFNAGGTIRISPTFTKNVNNQINNDWDDLINSIGTVRFGHTSTTSSTNTGTGSVIGYYDLTTTPQTVYTKGATVYSVNDYTVKAYCASSNNTSGTSATVSFEVSFNDDKTVNPNNDEVVDGILINEVRMFRPSGSNVAVATPTGSSTVRLDANQI